MHELPAGAWPEPWPTLPDGPWPDALPQVDGPMDHRAEPADSRYGVRCRVCRRPVRTAGPDGFGAIHARL